MSTLFDDYTADEKRFINLQAKRTLTDAEWTEFCTLETKLGLTCEVGQVHPILNLVRVY